MNYNLVIAFALVILFTLLFVFPKNVLAKFSYKEQTHPDDYDYDDVRPFYYFFGLLMTGAWVFFIFTLSGLV